MNDDIVLHAFSGDDDQDRLAYLSWDMLIEDPSSQHRVRHAILSGQLPAQVRHKLWMHASGAETLKGRNPGLFARLLSTEELPEAEEKKIQRDIRRTFGGMLALPDHLSLNDAVESLYRVLKVLCLYDDIERCPYAQGLNYIAAALLVQVTPETPLSDTASGALRSAGEGGETNGVGGFFDKILSSSSASTETTLSLASKLRSGTVDDIGGRRWESAQQDATGADGLRKTVEEDVFWLVVCLVHKLHVGCLLRTDLPYLHEYLQTFSTLVKARLPAVHLHLAKQNFSLTSFAVEWFTCLFTFSHPPAFVAHTLDLMFTGHPDVLFSTALILLKLSEKKLLRMNFEDLILNFRSLTQHSIEAVREQWTWANLKTRTLDRLTQQIGMREVMRVSSESPFFHNVDGHFPPRLIDFLKRANGMTIGQCHQLFVHEFETIGHFLGPRATRQLAVEALYRCCWWDAVVPAIAILQSGLCNPNCCLKVANRKKKKKDKLGSNLQGYNSTVEEAATGSVEKGEDGQREGRQRHDGSSVTGNVGVGGDMDVCMSPLHLCALRNAAHVSRVLLTFGASLETRSWVTVRPKAKKASIVSNMVAGLLPGVGGGGTAAGVADGGGEDTTWGLGAGGGDDTAQPLPSVAVLSQQPPPQRYHWTALETAKWSGDGQQRVAVQRVLEKKVCLHCGRLLEMLKDDEKRDPKDCEGCGFTFCQLIAWEDGKLSKDCFSVHHCPAVVRRGGGQSCGGGGRIGGSSSNPIGSGDGVETGGGGGRVGGVNSVGDFDGFDMETTLDLADVVGDGSSVLDQEVLHKEGADVSDKSQEEEGELRRHIDANQMSEGDGEGASDHLSSSKDRQGNDETNDNMLAISPFTQVEDLAACKLDSEAGAGDVHTIILDDGGSGRGGTVDDLSGSVGFGVGFRAKQGREDVMLGATGVSGRAEEGWQSDDDVWHCTLCMTPFSAVFVRRHHCRRCKRIFCGDCADVYSSIPPAYTSKVRICRNCYHYFVRECECFALGDSDSRRRGSNVPRCIHKPWDFYTDNVCFCAVCNV